MAKKQKDSPRSNGPKAGELLAPKLAPRENNVYGECYDPVNILGRRVAETCVILANMGATDAELRKVFADYGSVTLLQISEIEFRHRTDNPARKKRSDD